MTAQPSFESPAVSPSRPTALPGAGLPGAGDLAGWLSTAHQVITRVRSCLDGQGVVTDTDIRQIERLARRVEGVRLAALAAADAAGLPARSGASGTSAWFAHATGNDTASAVAQVALARRLRDGLDATRQALDDGALSGEHARIVAATLKNLPDDVSPAERDRIQEHLIAQASILNPARLRRAARRALEVIDRPVEQVRDHQGRQLRDEETAAGATTRFTLHDNGDGTTSGHFTIPTLAAEVLHKILQAMTAPRRHHPTPGTTTSPSSARRPGAAFTRHDPGVPAPGTRRPASAYTGTDAELDARALAADWAHAYGLAFTTLLEHLPTDHLHPKTAATIVVTLDLAHLVTGLGAAGTDTGTDISAADARRLACAAGIVPAVLGTESLPLDLGRSTRLFTQAQRLALATHYDTCAVDGCDRPYAWCEVHHITPWADGGTTTLANAVPACAFHHHQLDNPDCHHTITTDRHGTKTVHLQRRT